MSMRQESIQFTLRTPGRGMSDFTREVVDWVRQSGIQGGLLTLHVRHTSASLLIQENADPEVQRDMERFFSRLIPDGDPILHHTAEGPDDMPAHIRSALTATALSIPVVNGAPALGTWQGIYLCEHRTQPHVRRIAAHLIGE